MRKTQTKFGVVNTRRYGGEPVRIVALHGFTQHGGSFEELASLLAVGVAAVDLPGHGRTDVDPVTFDVAAQVVGEVLEECRAPTLLGYSQGGRIALQVALDRPDLVEELILISASPGIADADHRAARRAADAALADHIIQDGVETFIDEWLSREMFAGLRARSPEWRQRDRSLRIENQIEGLAAALRGLGQGAQPYLGGMLSQLDRPLLAAAGELDLSYRKHAERMAAASSGRVEVIGGAGHSVIGEQPEAVAAVIREFLASVSSRG